MAGADSGTTPQHTGGSTSGSKPGMVRGTESATYGKLGKAGAGVPGPSNGGQPYASNSPSKAPTD